MASVAAQAQESEAVSPGQDPIRVLFLGNSYTYQNNLPAMVERLSSAGETRPSLITLMVASGGATLERHASNPMTLKRIHSGDWDWVVLQEQSVRPVRNPDRMRRWARALNGKIKEAPSTPRTLLFMTWSRRDRPEMLRPLSEVYRTLALEIDAEVAPVGEAWHRVLLDESRPIALHAADGSHPSRLGSYLAACVIWSKIYGRSPVGLPTLGLDPEVARRLQVAAEASVDLPVTAPGPAGKAANPE
ncbi:hypothetical protein ABI59_08790 [Acidobacteria bacterium Mor1]|nr:hypothetical protein ABI59_08790 [Acidobacteria bacterium Mor1]